jgi:hypothetical protein
MNAYGFQCKTPGCKAWLKVHEMPEDSSRINRVPINLGEKEVLPLHCTDCGQDHDYNFSERQIAELVD